MKPIYLDNNAPTPLDPLVVDAMQPSYKMRVHRQCLSESRDRGGTKGVTYSLEELWRIREECIAALERASATAVVPETETEKLYRSQAWQL